MDTRLIVILLYAVFMVGVLIGRFMNTNSVERQLEELKYYKKTYLKKNGWTSFDDNKKGISYLLHSFDAGKNWYVIDRSVKGEKKIVGDVKVVYPGLLEHLNGWEDLIKHAEKNGPLTFSSRSKTNDINLLKNAGFTIKEK